MKTSFTLFLISLSAACAHTSHEQTTAADGRPAYTTSCRGEASDACLTEAAHTCGGHYAVLEHDTSSRAVAAGNGVRMANAGTTDVQHVTYRCDNVAH